MIQVEDREQIRRAYFIDGKSVRQIARELGHSRTTVRQAIAAAEPNPYTLTMPRAAPVLGPFKAAPDHLLEENKRLPRKQRYTSHKMYEAIHAQGYAGSESTVRGYVAASIWMG
jgi:transposase